jgi:hypothetical protein
MSNKKPPVFIAGANLVPAFCKIYDIYKEVLDEKQSVNGAPRVYPPMFYSVKQ